MTDRDINAELMPLPSSAEQQRDEPASVLLERLRAEREAGKVPKRLARRGKQADKDHAMAGEETYTNLALDL